MPTSRYTTTYTTAAFYSYGLVRSLGMLYHDQDVIVIKDYAIVKEGIIVDTVSRGQQMSTRWRISAERPEARFT